MTQDHDEKMGLYRRIWDPWLRSLEWDARAYEIGAAAANDEWEREYFREQADQKRRTMQQRIGTFKNGLE
jgi:hypothetical protein